MEELQSFLKMYRQSLTYALEVHEMMTMLGDAVYGEEAILGPQTEEKAGQWRKSMDRLVEVTGEAKKHIERNHEYAYELAIVRLWTAAEAGPNDLCVALLKHNPAWSEGAKGRNVKVNAIEFTEASETDRLYMILSALKSGSGSEGYGVGKVESVLNDLGLGGSVPETSKTMLISLAETRNLIVHRKGAVDREFLKKCPWMNVKVGERIKCGHEEFAVFCLAVWVYLMELGDRLARIGLPDPDPSRKEIIGSFEDRLNEALEKEKADNPFKGSLPAGSA